MTELACFVAETRAEVMVLPFAQYSYCISTYTSTYVRTRWLGSTTPP